MRSPSHGLSRLVDLAKSRRCKATADALGMSDGLELLQLLHVRVLRVQKPLGTRDDLVVSLSVDDLDPDKPVRWLRGQLAQHHLGKGIQAGGDAVVHNRKEDARHGLKRILERLPDGVDELEEVLLASDLNAIALRCGQDWFSLWPGR